jgi:hypothetical protein
MRPLFNRRVSRPHTYKLDKYSSPAQPAGCRTLQIPFDCCILVSNAWAGGFLRTHGSIHLSLTMWAARLAAHVAHPRDVSCLPSGEAHRGGALGVDFLDLARCFTGPGVLSRAACQCALR